MDSKFTLHLIPVPGFKIPKGICTKIIKHNAGIKEYKYNILNFLNSSMFLFRAYMYIIKGKDKN